MSVSAELYRRLPASIQSLAASARGYQLQSRRYGRETEILVSEALERDSWDAARWKSWQEERLARTLHHAATRVPYYREQWARRRRDGDPSSWEILANWPILSKQTLRDDPRSFLAEGSERGYETQTSGTTGTPLRLWQPRSTLVDWYALFEARIRRWNGVSLGDRWAHLGGQRITPIGRRQPPFWVWNGGMNQLYMSTYHIKTDTAAAYLEAMRRHRIRYIFGYASALYALAAAAKEIGAEAPPMRVAISNAETFYGFQREALASVFRCPVRDTYGQAEIVCGGSECSHGSMHLWPEVGLTEWMCDGSDEPVEPGRAGRMICTAFLNPAMPLIRYEVGDRSTLAPEGHRCGCGRGLPVVLAFDGRMFDLMLTPDGVPVAGLDTILHAGLPIREAQIIQETLLRFRIKVVPAPGFESRHRDDLVRGVHDQMGPRVDVIVEMVDSIPRTPAGKFPLQVSLLRGRAGGTP